MFVPSEFIVTLDFYAKNNNITWYKRRWQNAFKAFEKKYVSSLTNTLCTLENGRVPKQIE